MVEKIEDFAERNKHISSADILCDIRTMIQNHNVLIVEVEEIEKNLNRSLHPAWAKRRAEWRRKVAKEIKKTISQLQKLLEYRAKQK